MLHKQIEQLSVESIISEYLVISQLKENPSPAEVTTHIARVMKPLNGMLNSSSLEQHRQYNITLIAWAEWWSASIKRAQYIPQMRGLGEVQEMLQQPFGINRPHDWVDKRVTEIKASNNIQWQENDLAMPVYNSLPRFEPAHQSKLDEPDCLAMNEPDY